MPKCFQIRLLRVNQTQLSHPRQPHSSRCLKQIFQVEANRNAPPSPPWPRPWPGAWPNDRSAYSLTSRAGRPALVNKSLTLSDVRLAGHQKKRPGTHARPLVCVLFLVKPTKLLHCPDSDNDGFCDSRSWRRAPTRTTLKTFLRRPSQKTLPGMSVSVASTPTFWMRTTQPRSFVLQLKPC